MSVIIKKIGEFWQSEIVTILEGITDPMEFNRVINEINPKIYDELYQIMYNHVRSVFERGMREGSSRFIPSNEIRTMFNEAFKKSFVDHGIKQLSGRLYAKLTKLASVRDIIIANNIDMGSVLKSAMDTELRKFETMARTETQYMRNEGRKKEWQLRDPQGKYVYKWGIGKDHRTTECCKEIYAVVNDEIKNIKERGVSLKRLEQIVAFTGGKYFPEFTQRSLNPHYNCRSFPFRVV